MDDKKFCSLLAAIIAAGAFTGDEDDAHLGKIAKNAISLAQKIDGGVCDLFDLSDAEPATAANALKSQDLNAPES